MHKAVVDANVFVSALLKPGKPREVIEHLKADRFQLVYPEQLILELERAGAKPKLNIAQDEVTDLIRLITSKGVLVEPSAIMPVCRDPADDVYLACATLSGVKFIVTGDEDLLSLGEHAGAKIIRPAEFLNLIASST